MKWISSKPSWVCEKLPLIELLSNQLDDSKVASVTKHLDRCEYCQRRLTDLSADATWWREAAQWLENAAIEDAEVEDCLDDFSEHHGPSAESSLLQSGLMKPPSKPDTIGVIGRYDIRRIIGTGGTGIVLQAVDTELDRVVAVKVLSPTLAANGPARRRFSREGQAAASVVHDNVVAIHHVESDGPIPFLVMQFVEGSSLQELVMRSGPIDVISILRIVAQLASALAAAHSQGLVHRDVKPANILVGAAGQRVWITDFGLARAVDDASLTRTGFIAGTPHYVSPEQARGENVSARSDLFGLGSVMYFALTGRPPFRADRSLAILNRICNDRHRPVREVNPDVPLPVAAIVDRLLEKNPSDRFQAAEEVRSECLHLLSDPDALLESESPLTETVVARQVRNRTAAYLAVFLVLIVASFWTRQFADGIAVSNLFSMPLTISSGNTFDDDLPRRISSGTTFDVDSLNASPSRERKPSPEAPKPQAPKPRNALPDNQQAAILSESESWRQAFSAIEGEVDAMALQSSESSELQLQSRGIEIATVGSQLTYHATLANPTDQPAQNVTLHMRIPPGMQLVSASPQPQQNQDQLLWDQGVLSAQRQLEVRVVLMPVQPGEFLIKFSGMRDSTLASRVATRVFLPSIENESPLLQSVPETQLQLHEPVDRKFDEAIRQIEQLLQELELPFDDGNVVAPTYSVS